MFLFLFYWLTLSDVTAESAATAANRLRHSSPIRSPRLVEQRIR